MDVGFDLVLSFCRGRKEGNLGFFPLLLLLLPHLRPARGRRRGRGRTAGGGEAEHHGAAAAREEEGEESHQNLLLTTRTVTESAGSEGDLPPSLQPGLLRPVRGRAGPQQLRPAGRHCRPQRRNQTEKISCGGYDANNSDW